MGNGPPRWDLNPRGYEQEIGPGHLRKGRHEPSSCACDRGHEGYKHWAKKAGAMQLVGCDRIHEEITRNRTGTTTPRERMLKRRMKATVCSWWAVTTYMKK
jgi:hypothetical protein